MCTKSCYIRRVGGTNGVVDHLDRLLVLMCFILMPNRLYINRYLSLKGARSERRNIIFEIVSASANEMDVCILCGRVLVHHLTPEQDNLH